MIEYKCEKGNVTLNMKGNVIELTADALLFCIVVYKEFKQRSQKAADEFVEHLDNIRELIDDCEELEQAAKEKKDKIDKFFDALNELADRLNE